MKPNRHELSPSSNPGCFLTLSVGAVALWRDEAEEDGVLSVGGTESSASWTSWTSCMGDWSPSQFTRISGIERFAYILLAAI
jgi:hypothetical protein